ncbi:ABC transporter permease/M1 family aminopeptidase [Nitrospirillum iridis]|uniref:ABC-type transport system involved in multi-copper enzyme maturation permease subunit n=1 Tax=Nitrospirillum iridis TaxID=765888 RepID=A0A7X0ECM1_9PROT|nr:M1 family aminopeptidase [Nitrospirillum iridis]MBB6251803.1 ABC-type transport system involved in multi-copper enzyme maturation permease subunit [Nitrospirillum iridis]
MAALCLLARIAWFELRYQLRQPALIINFLIFFLMTFLATTVDQIQVGGRSNGVHMDSPFVVLQIAAILSLFAMTVGLRGLTDPVLRDADTGMAGMVGATPVPRPLLLTGRLLGAFVACAIAVSSCQWGIVLGRLAWWVDPEHFGAFRPLDYMYALGLFSLPNLLVTGALFFSVAAFTRRQMATYIVMIALIAVYAGTSSALGEPAYRALAGYIDPFGLAPYANVTRYWTVVERNSQLPALTSALLVNRAIWISVGLALVGIGLAGDRWATRRGPLPAAAAKPAPDIPSAPPPLRPVAPHLGLHAAWTMARRRLGFEVGATLRSPSFWILLTLSIINMVAALLTQNKWYGIPAYPVTRLMVELILGTFTIAPLAIASYYTGELVWRERQAGMADILGATPAPGWVFTVSKFLTVAMVLAGLWLVAILPAVAVQIARGPVTIEPGLYLTPLLGMAFPDMLIVAALTLFAQVLSPNKFVGYAIMVVYTVLLLVAQRLGLEDNLLLYGGAPDLRLSDMNGYGHFLTAHTWFNIYWGAAALLLLLLTHLLWPRSRALTWRDRGRALVTGWTLPTGALAGLLVLAFIGSGVWIHHNTHVLNTFRTQDGEEARQVALEQAYRQYETLPQPRITKVAVDVDLYPDVQGFDARGRYTLENRTGAPLSQVHMAVPPDIVVEKAALEGGRLTTEDHTLNYYIFTLDQPLAPGDHRQLDFSLSQRHPGFTNRASAPLVVDNGSFIGYGRALPIIGLDQRLLLQDKFRRRKNGLPPIDRLPKLEDQSQWAVSDLGRDADMVDFETTISTVPDQTAIAPGYLEKEWTAKDAEGCDRRYFHYRSDSPIAHFESWLSARYAVARDHWGEGDHAVDLAVYYHQPHAWNVARMMEGMKRALTYASDSFGPYQHRQLRVLEFPDYSRFAQSFPNTVPYSEGIGFVSDLRDKSKIDAVFYVTAHEVAHQWWGHQLVAANVQGNTLLVESLAQYTALMVMEHEYGPNQIRKFLKYELDRYLAARGREELEELPLVRVEGQGYIHYQKGSLAMYALKDYLGEDVVNRALARLLKESKARTDRYALSTDLVAALKAEAPDQADLISDMLEKIVLYDLKVVRSDVEALPDGRFKVNLTVSASKFEADGQGKETPIPFIAMPIDIGLFRAEPGTATFGDHDVIHLAKHPLHFGEQTIELVVDKKPDYVGIDPYNKLIDRNSDDNVARLGQSAQ